MPCTLWYTVPCPCNFACFLAFLLASLLCFDYCSACLDVLDASAWLLRCFAGLAAVLLWCLLLLWCFDLGPKNKSLQLQDGVRVLFFFFFHFVLRGLPVTLPQLCFCMWAFSCLFFRKTMILHYEAECSYFFILCLAGLRVLCLNCVAAYAYSCALPYSLKPDHFKYRAECSYFSILCYAGLRVSALFCRNKPLRIRGGVPVSFPWCLAGLWVLCLSCVSACAHFSCSA